MCPSDLAPAGSGTRLLAKAQTPMGQARGFVWLRKGEQEQTQHPGNIESHQQTCPASSRCQVGWTCKNPKKQGACTAWQIRNRLIFFNRESRHGMAGESR